MVLSGVCGSYLRRWLLMLILAAALSAADGCPRSCVCSVPSEVHCTFKYLNTIPDQIQTSVEKVNLGYNSVTLLRVGDFSGLKKLEQLLLHSNSIHNIEDRAFEDLKSLQVLKLSYNKIKELDKDTFKGLDNLLRLHLDHNNIDFINPEALNGLNHLQLLNLEGNQLQQLHPDTFTTLRHSQVFKVSSLRTIQLSDNLLTRLPENIFSGCTQLENLFLHGNRWSCDCHMSWFPAWTQINKGLLKCKKDRRYPRGLCAVCERPSSHHNKPLSILPTEAFSCSRPWIQQLTKRKNVSVEEGDFFTLHPKDFIAPLGSVQMNFTDQFENDASVSCTVQRPSHFENLTLTPEEDGGTNTTRLTAGITTFLVCNIDNDNIQQLWQILAGYSDFPLRLERGSMLAGGPEMVYRYTQRKPKEGLFASIEADIKAVPAWLMQSGVDLQLDRTTTTYSTLHIKYQSEVNLRVENSLPKKDHYSWAMIKKDNMTRTEHVVLSGGVAQLTCQFKGEPTPFLEWILPDGSKVRAPYSSEDRRIIISAEGKLSLRGADTSDSGLYMCITTNYLDADILSYRLTVVSPYVEDEELNGIQVLKQHGGNLLLDCMTTGSPESPVQWILPDQTIFDTSYGNRKVFSNGSLLIEGLTARDQGFYRCLAVNYLGVDLFVSQVKVEGSDKTTSSQREGSGTELGNEDTAKSKEDFTSPVHSEGMSEESRTIASDHPYPKLRGKGSSSKRLRQRGRGTFRNRHNWRRRVFNKSTKNLDHETFAKFMKKAEDTANARSAKEEKLNEESNNTEDDVGSGQVLKEDDVFTMLSTLRPIITTSQGRIVGETHKGYSASTISSQDVSISDQVTESRHLKTTSHVTLQKPTVTQMEKMSDIDVIPNPDPQPVSDRISNLYESDYTTKSSTLNSSAGLHPILAITSQNTQSMFSGEWPSQPDTTTHSAVTFADDPRVTPMMDDPGRVNLVVHTDPASKRTFTAVTTTEGQQEQITFHTTQTIKSSRLPPGSTIISQQQIHIIPKKSRKRGGRRKLIQSQRRILKPNKTSDIQSIINKIQQAAVKERNSTLTYTIQLTTDAAYDHVKTTAENSQKTKTTPDAISVEAPSQTTSSLITQSMPTKVYIPSAYSRPQKQLLISATPATTILPETKRPVYVPSTTKASTLLTQFPTAEKLSTEPKDMYVPRKVDSMERPSGDDYGDSSMARFTTDMAGVEYITTTSSSARYTTVEPTSKLETIPSPPTVKSLTTGYPDETSASGSGVVLDDWLFISAKPEKKEGFEGQKGKLKSGTKPPIIPRSITTEKTFLETEKRLTAIPQQGVIAATNVPSTTTKRQVELIYPKQMPEQKKDTEETDVVWNRVTKRPLDYTTTMFPSTSKGFHTTIRNRISIYNKPTKQTAYGKTDNRKSIMKNTSSAQIINTLASADKSTLSKTEQGRSRHYNKKEMNIGISRLTGSPPTNAHVSSFETTTNSMTSKPRIVGGNAASFTVLSNSDSFLPCEAVGHPRPNISWKRFSPRTGSTIAIDYTKGKYWILENGTLSIQNTNIQDQGQYICLAENNYGSDKLLVTLSVVAYPSRILEPKMQEMKLHTGNTVKMNCKAEGRPSPVISWILANQTQVNEQSRSFGRTSVVAGGTLVIENVSVYDRGLYKCIASNPAGVDTITVRLQVVAAPPDILEDKRQQLKVAEHKNILLPCTGRGNPYPAVHWVLVDGTVVKPNGSPRTGRITVYNNGTLLIKDINQRDTGKYECIATSSTGSERRVVTLSVEKQETAPQIVGISQRVTELFFGDQLKLDCSATGDPKPRIIWRLPSKAVVDQWHRMGSRIKVLENGTLVIKNVIDKDDGDYLCVARSRIGDDLQLLKVSVSMKPAKIEAKVHDKKEVTYGNDLKVDCKASGAPKPEISWGLPDGTVVNKAFQEDASAGGARHRRYTLFDNGTLYLNQVGMSEEGDYICFAENQVGKDEMHVHITVVAAIPKIHQPKLTNLRVKHGGNVRFDCEAVGEPKPKILWTLPSNDIIAASNERYLMHVNGSLDIRDVKRFDAGEYVCLARNNAGEAKKVFKLDIDGNPPVINGHQLNRTVIKEYAIKYSRKLIDCKVDGNPTPSITWIMPDNIFLKAPYFGSRIIVHYNGTLEMRNVRPTDTAEFICLARNDGGEAVMIVELEVTHMMRRPIFKNPFNERVSSSIGRSTILNCSADGHPQPEIIWTLPDGTRLTGGGVNTSHHRVGPDGSLVIKESQMRDGGKYRCGAKNTLGYIEKLIILDVGAKPYILSRPRGIIRSVFGETLVLHCLSDGSPRPSISWTMPGGHTVIAPQVFGRHQLLENGTLVIQDSTLRDRGNYVCRAQNEAGQAVLTVPVMIVAYPPRITTSPPSNVQVIPGTLIQLNCAASGIPKPEITWEMPDHSILSTADQAKALSNKAINPYGALILQTFTVSDIGTYKCVAKNQLGTDLKTIYVHVL